MGKENAEADCSYAEIADQLRCYTSQPKAQLKELFKRICFSILVSNNDDHLKNHGFLYTGNGQWNLSPAFDVNPDPDRGDSPLYLKTLISEGNDGEARVEALIEVSERFELKKEGDALLISEMAHIIQEKWKNLAKEAGMSSRNISAYDKAFNHAESRKALLLG